MSHIKKVLVWYSAMNSEIETNHRARYRIKNSLRIRVSCVKIWLRDQLENCDMINLWFIECKAQAWKKRKMYK